MHWLHLVNISQKGVLADTLKMLLGREDCLAVNSRSTGPQQQNTDDQNSLDDNAELSTCTDRQTTNIDDQQRRPLVCSCSSGIASHSMKTPIHQHVELELYWMVNKDE